MIQKFEIDSSACKFVVDSFFNSVEAVEKQFCEWLEENKRRFNGCYDLLGTYYDDICEEFIESFSIKGVYDYLPVDDYREELIEFYKVLIRGALKTYKRSIFSESANTNCKTKIIYEK